MTWPRLESRLEVLHISTPHGKFWNRRAQRRAEEGARGQGHTKCPCPFFLEPGWLSVGAWHPQEHRAPGSPGTQQKEEQGSRRQRRGGQAGGQGTQGAASFPWCRLHPSEQVCPSKARKPSAGERRAQACP